jgi:hypothetical protein
MNSSSENLTGSGPTTAHSILVDVGIAIYDLEEVYPKIRITPKGHYAVGKLLNKEEVELTAPFYYASKTAWDVIYTLGQSGMSPYQYCHHMIIIILRKYIFMFPFSQDNTRCSRHEYYKSSVPLSG